MIGLRGKVAIVSGGGGSIGSEIVESFCAAGVKVMIADRDLAPSVEHGRNKRRQIACHQTDITSDADIRACIDLTAKQFGGIDILVNVCAIYDDHGAGSSRETWLHAFNVNVVSAARFSHFCAPSIIARGGGSIVNFGSVAARFGQRTRAVYPVTKAAILQLTRSQAIEWAGQNVRVNSVSPGWTWSAAVARLSQGDRARADRIGARFHPLGKIGDGSDVANAVMFLCSDAAKHITGTDLPVDGGFSAIGADGGTPGHFQLEASH